MTVPRPILLLAISMRGHGGLEQDMRRCLETWARQGRSIGVISAFPDFALTERLQTEGHWIHRIPIVPRPVPLAQAWLVSRMRPLIRKWKQQHPDGIVISFERIPVAEVCVGISPIRLWWEARKNAGLPTWNRPGMRIWQAWCDDYIQQHAQTIVVYSKTSKQAWIDKGVPPHRIQRVIIPRNLNFFRPPQDESHPSEILFIGSAYRLKGADLVLAAWDRYLRKALPDFRLRIVCKPQSSTARAAKGVEGVLVSPPVDDPREYYWRAALLLAPSVMESWGNVVVEALACGVPVITTTATPASEVIQNHLAGYVFSRSANLDRDARTLSELALKAVRDSDQWNPSLRKARWEIVQAFQERHDTLFSWAEKL